MDNMDRAFKLRGSIRVLELLANKQRFHIKLPSEDAIMDKPSKYIKALERTEILLGKWLNDTHELKKELDV